VERENAFPPGEGAMPLPDKKMFFFKLEMAFWCILSGTFCLCLARKMLNFPPEVAIWWTLKMREILNTLLEYWGC